jgi:membrane carboxypeptidase/penicillin-binding protein PbpC
LNNAPAILRCFGCASSNTNAADAIVLKILPNPTSNRIPKNWKAVLQKTCARKPVLMRRLPNRILARRPYVSETQGAGKKARIQPRGWAATTRPRRVGLESEGKEVYQVGLAMRLDIRAEM